MSYLAQNIQYLLDKNNINAYQLQEKSNIAQSTTFRIINGDTKSPSSTTVQKYAKYFGVEESDLRFKDLSDSIKTQEDGDNFKVVEKKPVRYVPLLNFVQAGEFCEYHDDAISDEFRPIFGEGYGEHVYWVALEGDSMEPDFKSGELVLIDPDMQPNPADYVVALRKGEKKVTFKKWRPRGFDEKTGKEYSQLIPSNENYPIIDSRFVPFTICGVAVERKQMLRTI
ncbi:LexA family transcriptional regulator [Psychrobacter sp. MES7-P7E]|uniref:LexA family transcriptional regulator n=1 Tax=Psychrobacter sp. MES7-P7E TaxID=2058322 RepID=UPI001D17B07F|nr:S24 family peptidase [Psychrobacter sp. MES7-P7E]